MAQIPATAEEGGLTMTDKTWGGARPGAGRKPAGDDKRVQMVITVKPETRDFIKDFFHERRIRPGRLIDDLVEGHRMDLEN